MNGWVVSCNAVPEVMHQLCTPKPGRKAPAPQERQREGEGERGEGLGEEEVRVREQGSEEGGTRKPSWKRWHFNRVLKAQDTGNCMSC